MFVNDNFSLHLQMSWIFKVQLLVFAGDTVRQKNLFSIFECRSFGSKKTGILSLGYILIDTGKYINCMRGAELEFLKSLWGLGTEEE